MEKLTKKLPDSPGVYFFKKGAKILYIGKATSLKDRVKSYFRNDVVFSRGEAIVQMVALADKIDFIKTDSVLEALILESSLIKKYWPKYNVQEKDDRSYNFVVITKEEFPRVLIVRGKELAQENKKGFKKIFGPFPYGGELKEAMKIVRKIFPYREKCRPEMPKPCFEAQIGLCPGVCAGQMDREEYSETIKNIELLFSGKKKFLVRELSAKMKKVAREQKFEEANALKSQIFGLKHINDISLIKNKDFYLENIKDKKTFRIEAYDIAHMSGQNRVGVMTVILDGASDRSEYRKFKIKNIENAGDTGDLKEILDRRFYHEEWRLPDLIVVDGGKAQLNVAKKIISDLKLNIPVVAVTKGEGHRPMKVIGDNSFARKYESLILLANSEAHRFAISYHKKIRSGATGY